MGTWGRAVLGSVLLLAGCTASGGTAAPVASAAGSAPTGCGSKVETGPAAGLGRRRVQRPTRGVPHVFGAKSSIVAACSSATR